MGGRATGLGTGDKETSYGDGNVSHLDLFRSCVNVCVKIHQTVHLRFAHCTAYKLYLIKSY